MPYYDQIKLVNHSSIFIEAKSPVWQYQNIDDPLQRGLAFNNGWANMKMK